MTRRNRQSGFTLTEVMVATFLLTVGLFAASSTILAIHQRQKLSSTMMTATNLAQSKIEDLEGSDFDSVASLTEDYGDLDDHPTYRRVTAVTTNADDSLKSVTVTVTARQGSTVVLQSLIARK